jgi:UDP-3-O-[3-hydroxymyristoyl] glucosamine N-acyltransferase
VRDLGGEVVAGDHDTLIFGVDQLGDAESSDLVFAEDADSARAALESWAGAAVLPMGFVPPPECGMTVISAKNPRLWFAGAARLLSAKTKTGMVDPAAIVSSEARLGRDVRIGPGAVVGALASIGPGTSIDSGAVIGEGAIVGMDCHIHPCAVVYPWAQIGDRVIVHAGAVLGADGFGYVRDRETGRYTQFPQQGKLFIEDDVEIGANTTIDRGALSETRIRRGTKIDNLVHIGHNCDIGEDVVIAAQTGISGSSTVGNGAVIAGQVGIGDHAHVGPGVVLGGQAGVLSGKSVNTTGTVLWGTPAKPLREYLRELATLARLSRRKKE